jgi:hypothetical protein
MKLHLENVEMCKLSEELYITGVVRDEYGSMSDLWVAQTEEILREIYSRTTSPTNNHTQVTQDWIQYYNTRKQY